MYAEVAEHRMPYDIDGTEVGFRSMSDLSTISQIIGNGIASWLDSTAKGNLNKENRSQSWKVGDYRLGSVFWFFFPELREVNKVGFYWSSTTVCSFVSHTIQGSADTTNGVDGTWETGVYTIPAANTDMDHWRNKIFTLSFSGPVKAIRIGFRETSPQFEDLYICGVHLYGRKAVGEQVNDVVMTDASGVDLTSLIDFGDQPEGTTEIQSFKIKNTSNTKIANNVNIQLNHEDFTISFSQDGPWQSVLDISSIGPGSLSSTIFVRNLLGPPLLTLGPKAARAIVTVGSWT
ncbi:hypothetical protein LPY66_00730 [Dehalobacter sp. DCM]|uniref:hypothetical protein n=1 Tax=Dehalobacter sp. DCM TaxID=2907827 RepID=UPI0030813D86|nr:hypothetical protein LPY66_00730 [Dehalobacter sp. DCM]